MAQKLTGGALLLRNKYFIVIYRGKDFVPTSVAAVLAERQELTKQVQDAEEKVRCRTVDKTLSGEDDANGQAGSLAEFYEAQARWGRDISNKEREKMMKEATEAKNVRLIKKVELKLASVSIRLSYEDFMLKRVFVLLEVLSLLVYIRNIFLRTFKSICFIHICNSKCMNRPRPKD